MELNWKQKKGIIGIVLVLFGILAFPILMEKLFGYDAIGIAFIVIVIYAILDYWMRKGK